jgi:Nucleotidyl transferase AbiEii toxin, Type IV TA system
MTSARIATTRYRAESDPADADQQTVLFWYPVVTAAADHYIQSAVKIEAGAKSALDPHVLTGVRPYAADDLPDIDLQVAGITTVEPQRTFWDKVVILHGLRTWYDRRGQLRHGGQRVSRHYFDIFRVLQSPLAEQVQNDRDLAADCARHARMFFNNPDFDLNHAMPGTLTLTPPHTMLELLERDYDAMAVMITGAVPPLAEILAAISALERRLNASKSSK